MWTFLNEQTPNLKQLVQQTSMSVIWWNSMTLLLLSQTPFLQETYPTENVWVINRKVQTLLLYHQHLFPTLLDNIEGITFGAAPLTGVACRLLVNTWKSFIKKSLFCGWKSTLFNCCFTEYVKVYVEINSRHYFQGVTQEGTWVVCVCEGSRRRKSFKCSCSFKL